MPEDRMLERLEKLEGIVETTVQILPPLINDLSRRIDGLREEVQGMAAKLEGRIQAVETKLEDRIQAVEPGWKRIQKRPSWKDGFKKLRPSWRGKSRR